MPSELEIFAGKVTPQDKFNLLKLLMILISDKRDVIDTFVDNTSHENNVTNENIKKN